MGAKLILEGGGEFNLRTKLEPPLGNHWSISREPIGNRLGLRTWGFPPSVMGGLFLFFFFFFLLKPSWSRDGDSLAVQLLLSLYIWQLCFQRTHAWARALEWSPAQNIALEVWWVLSPWELRELFWGSPFRIFGVFLRFFALWSLLRPLFWRVRGAFCIAHFPRIGFESLISKMRPTGFTLWPAVGDKDSLNGGPGDTQSNEWVVQRGT